MEEIKYYNNLDNTIFDDNRKFWKRINLLFSEKGKTLPKDIILIKEDIVISRRDQVANTLNNFFVDAVSNREIELFYPLYSSDSQMKPLNMS